MNLQIKQSPGKPLVWVVTIILIWILIIPLPAAAAQQKKDISLENRLKAAFVFNFINFVEWPEDVLSRSQHFDICILGVGSAGEALKSLEEREMPGRSLKVRSLDTPDETGDCHILYIQTSWNKQMERIKTSVKERPLLTISDFDGFSSQGGMITLITVQNRMRFIINNRSARMAGLNISSKLLNLAIQVID